MITKLIQEIVVPNRAGLHARASMKLLMSGKQYTSAIKLYKGSACADAKNMLDLLSLGAAQGEKLKLEVEGEDAQDAMQAVLNLFAASFGENDED